jgi:hypothetical protein
VAGDWIKMRGNLWDDPRVSKLCDLCDCGEAQVVGGLYWLWATADQHSEDGFMPGLTLRQIDRKTGLHGFGAALCSIGWLADQQDGVQIVRFGEHNGSSAKKRAVTSRRVATHRAGNSEGSVDNESISTDVTHPALQKESDCVTGALAREREEKRREDTSPDGEGGKPDQPGVADPCPHQQIIEAYHRLLPMGRQVREWTPARASALRSRWRENPKRQSLAWWERFFGYVAQSAFLTGKTQTPDRRPFEVSLDWLVKSENMVKVVEGAYHEAEREAA